MKDIYRIFECQDGVLTELVFIAGKENAIEYLASCQKHNTDETIFYFSEKIKIEN